MATFGLFEELYDLAMGGTVAKFVLNGKSAQALGMQLIAYSALNKQLENRGPVDPETILVQSNTLDAVNMDPGFVEAFDADGNSLGEFMISDGK